MPEASADGGRQSFEAPLRITAIAVGGAAGTLCRYGVERSLAVSPGRFPWATFWVNVAGSFLLGVIVTLVTERWPPTRFVRPLAAIGFCGGFTTFSTMAVEVARLGQHGHVATAAGYVGASLVVGVLAAATGMLAARGRLLPPAGGPIPDPDDLGAFRHRPPATRSDDRGGAR